jgi:hypothetical protein
MEAEERLAELESKVVKECPKCSSNIKFDPGATTAKCKVCKREYALELGEGKDPKDPINYKMTRVANPVDVFGKIALAIMLVASVIMIIFALIANHQITDGLEDNTGGYTLTN